MWQPMKNLSTSVVSVKKLNNVRVQKQEKLMRPSERTLTFLKLFARNYQVEKSLPDGLQGLILG